MSAEVITANIASIPSTAMAFMEVDKMDHKRRFKCVVPP
jgi:hypothetical protein